MAFCQGQRPEAEPDEDSAADSESGRSNLPATRERLGMALGPPGLLTQRSVGGEARQGRGHLLLSDLSSLAYTVSRNMQF